MAANNPILGATIQWTLQQGAMAGKSFEHTFERDGTIKYRMLNGNSDETSIHSEIAQISDDVWAVSYLGSAGYTLTAILDFKTHKLVSFASNEKELGQQTGTFQVVRMPPPPPRAAGVVHSANRH